MYFKGGGNLFMERKNMKPMKNWILCGFLGAALAVMLTATALAADLQKGLEAYDAGDYATALSILKPLAEAGNADAQLTLSWMYYFGRGVPQDDAEWTKWRDRAFNVVDGSAQDTPTATGTLGTIEVSEDDFHEGVRAYANGDYATAYAKIFPLAELQNADALYFLGLMYYNGHGVEQDYEEAAHTLRQSAKGGNTDAQNLLGVMYDHGKGVPQNVEEAEQWFRRAAAAGHAEAQQNLERLLASIEAAAEAVTPADDLQKGLAAYEAGDYETALAILTPLAWAGNADAQNTLGWMYDYGHGVEENDAEAVKWYRPAAEQGNAIAQNNLGKMYEYGIGVSQNDEEAIKWYRSAAEQGHAEARQNLDGLLASTASAADGTASSDDLWGTFNELFDDLESSTDDSAEPANDNTAPVADDTAAVEDVQRGIEAIWAEDYDTAFAIFKPLAEAGDATAQYQLGRMYYHYPRSFFHDDDTVDAAEKWWLLALEGLRPMAEAGDAEAQYMLGRLHGYSFLSHLDPYLIQLDVYQSQAEQRKWFRRAAEAGNPYAAYQLAFYLNDAINNEDKWYRPAAEGFRRAAEAGDAEAAYQLGRMYHWGSGVERDGAEGNKWFRRAIELGQHAEAQRWLDSE